MFKKGAPKEVSMWGPNQRSFWKAGSFQRMGRRPKQFPQFDNKLAQLLSWLAPTYLLIQGLP